MTHRCLLLAPSWLPNLPCQSPTPPPTLTPPPPPAFQIAPTPVIQLKAAGVAIQETIRAPYNTSSGCDCVKSLRLCLHGTCPQTARARVDASTRLSNHYDNMSQHYTTTSQHYNSIRQHHNTISQYYNTISEGGRLHQAERLPGVRSVPLESWPTIKDTHHPRVLQ